MGDRIVIDRGSIPACAGEPLAPDRTDQVPEVYPRVCGGTSFPPYVLSRAHGLSPRVRGNHCGRAGEVAVVGSIPACAGEPRRGCLATSTIRVYPRVCGGTSRLMDLPDGDLGLSPRVRGNHLHTKPDQIGNGSIPACAGEPAKRPPSCRGWRVYPRVCGGTRSPDPRSTLAAGLSPRVRGNLFASVRQGAHSRSIPACAGEPPATWRSGCSPTVYPRVCGGTHQRHQHRIDNAGLSPRVRGNRSGVRDVGVGVGSIPACAGEPACL